MEHSSLASSLKATFLEHLFFVNRLLATFRLVFQKLCLILCIFYIIRGFYICDTTRILLEYLLWILCSFCKILFKYSWHIGRIFAITFAAHRSEQRCFTLHKWVARFRSSEQKIQLQILLLCTWFRIEWKFIWCYEFIPRRIHSILPAIVSHN